MVVAIHQIQKKKLSKVILDFFFTVILAEVYDFQFESRFQALVDCLKK